MKDNIYLGIIRQSYDGANVDVGFTLANSAEKIRENHVRLRKDKKARSKTEKVTEEENFPAVSQAFFEQMIAFLDIFPLGAGGIPLARSALLSAHFESHVFPLGKKIVAETDLEIHEIPNQHFLTVNRFANQLRRQLDSLEVIPSTLLLGLVSQFDGFMGRLIRVLAVKKPHIVFESDRSFSAKELFAFDDMDAVRCEVLEKEIEKVLRLSHKDQFIWLEKKLGKPLREGLAVWGEFIEVFERRNLFAHTNGKVTASYLKNCDSNGHAQDVLVGQTLKVTPEYLSRATGILLEVGVKLSQTVWRMVSTDASENEQADDALREICYELLCHEHYLLAKSLLDFSLSGKITPADQTTRFISKVNKAIAHKYLGESDEMNNELRELESLPLDKKFLMCIAGVRDDYESLKKLVKPGISTEMQIQSFIEWPAFKEVRKDAQFLELLEECYGDAFVRNDGP